MRVVAEKICMKDLKLVIAVVLIALGVRIVFLRDSLSSVSGYFLEIETLQSLKLLVQSLLINRFYLYVMGVVYLIIFARKNSIKQLWNSFNEDLSPVLRVIVYVIGFVGFSAVSAYIHLYLK